MRDATKIVLLLDRSGSMGDCKANMEEVLNGYILLQQKEPGECLVALAQFDTKFDWVFKNVPIKNVGKITIEPRGGTALLDAMGQSIDEVGKELAALPETERPNKVMFVVITDGYENSSQVYVPSEEAMKAAKFVGKPLALSSVVNDMVTHQREKYSWNFIFLGADQDAIAAATSMGISAANTLNYSSQTFGSIKGMGDRLNKMSASYIVLHLQQQPAL